MNLADLFPPSACIGHGLPTDPQSAAVVDALCASTPPDSTEIALRTLALFGPPLTGIAAPVDGVPACIHLARRIVQHSADVTERPIPSDLHHQLERLPSRVEELGRRYPDLARARARALNPQVRFYLATHGSSFDRTLGLAAHLYLAAKSRILDANALAATRTPLVHLARSFDCTPFGADPSPAALAALLVDIRALFAALPSHKHAGRVLKTETVNGYMTVIAELLELRQRHHRPPAERQYPTRSPKPTIARSIAPVADNPSLAARQADALLDDPDADTDPANPYHPAAYRAAAYADDPTQADLLLEADAEALAGLPPADTVARREYGQAWATLARYVTPDDPRCLPLSTVALGYSALLGAAFSPLPRMQLAALTLYHLTLITCRSLTSLLATQVATPDLPEATPRYDPVATRLSATPRFAPGLMPDARGDHDTPQRPHPSYQPVQHEREIVIDDIARALLTAVYAGRGRCATTPHLFTDDTGHRLTSTLATHAICDPITRALCARYGDYRPVTLAHIRQTGWAQLVAVERVQPIYLGMVADAPRLELRVAAFYSTISHNHLAAHIGAAHHRLLARIEAVHPDGPHALVRLRQQNAGGLDG